MLSIAICTHRAAYSCGRYPASQGQIACKGEISSHRTFDEFCGYGILIFDILFCGAMAKKAE
jgi:hypothetical protein